MLGNKKCHEWVSENAKAVERVKTHQRREVMNISGQEMSQRRRLLRKD